MTRDETQAGTPVLEISADEYRDFLDEEASGRLGVSAEEFRRRYIAGELDDSDRDVGMLAALIAIGQNDDHAAAYRRAGVRRSPQLVLNRTVTDARLSLIGDPSYPARFALACLRGTTTLTSVALHGSNAQACVEGRAGTRAGRDAVTSRRAGVRRSL